jgi:flagellar basal-body rod protein FlgB
MAAQDLTLVKAIMQKMEWQEQRQKVLSQNIANADTPHYQPQDIKPIDFKDLLTSSTSKISLSAPGLATTNVQHIALGGSSASTPNAKAKNQKDTYETSPSGNAVVLEEQLLKLNENATDHQFISNLYAKQMQLLKESTK